MLVPDSQQGQVVDAAQAVGLHLLDRWQSVCLAHNLTYHLGGGTLLGAIRDQSFIPWDDEIDVTMPRADFDRLVAIHRDDPTIFGPDCLFDDGQRTARFGRLLYLPSSSAGRHLHMDIIIFDAVPKHSQVSRLTCWLTWGTGLAFWLAAGHPDPIQKRLPRTQAFLARCARFIGAQHLRRLHDSALALNRALSDPDTWDVVVGFRPRGRSRPGSWYRGSRTAMFEGVAHPVPTESETILRMLYGPDYMTPRPDLRVVHVQTPLHVQLQDRTWDIA